MSFGSKKINQYAAAMRAKWRVKGKPYRDYWDARKGRVPDDPELKLYREMCAELERKIDVAMHYGDRESADEFSALMLELGKDMGFYKKRQV